jgi:DNA-binding NarL/FixJ family response regulator
MGDNGSQLWRLAEIELLLAEGKGEEALAAVDPYERLADWRVNPAWMPVHSLRARALEMLGRTDEARAELDQELDLARAWGAPGTIGRTLTLLGMTEREQGVERLEQAVASLEGSPARLELAKALAALGATLRRKRKQTEAREPLRRAFEIAERSGATALAASIRSELHASGVRPRGSALKGPAALTASERRVADLAAQGQTNKQIAQTLYVTPKTVEVHLSNAYRKLEISSRGELPEALAEDA